MKKKCDSYISKDPVLSQAIAADKERIIPRDALKKRAPNTSYEDVSHSLLPPQLHIPLVQDPGTLSVKVLLFKKLRELESSKLREIVQELIQRYPKCIKEIDADGLKLRLDDLTAEQLKDIIQIVDGVIVDQNKDAKGNGKPNLVTAVPPKEKVMETVSPVEV